MFIERLLNEGNVPVLESVLQFTSARHRLLAENIVNADTPGYRQKDLSLPRFQQLLGEQIDSRATAAPGSTGFDEIRMQIEYPQRGILFHDGNNRSMEQLMTDQAKNAMMHNMAIEMLRKQYQLLDLALKEKVA